MQILCATDFLAKTEPAIDRAACIGIDSGADVALLHVVVPGESEWELEQTLQSAYKQLRFRAQPPFWPAPVTPEVMVRAGDPAQLILDTLEHANASLLLLGPHRKRPVRDALKGTIAAKALASKQCPVLVVRSEARTRYRRVLLALDMSNASATAIRAAESLVLTPEVDAQVVHANEPPYQGIVHATRAGVSYADIWSRGAEEDIRNLLKRESTHFRRYDVMVKRMHPALAILRALERFEPDLLVMGTSGGGPLRRALLGSVANRVLHDIECDALIVPDGSFGRRTRLRSVVGSPMGRWRTRDRPSA
jgi:universal stress protein E